MRYTRNGPDIPESLLQAQQSGKLVLFCGAGVSKEVGLPTFPELTKHILDTFHADEESPSMKYYNTWADSSSREYHVPFDSIFTDLHNVFGEKEVNDEIAKYLVALESKVSCLTHFSDILDISTSSQRGYHVVTTNFDRLLEKANSGSIAKVSKSEFHKDRVMIKKGIAYLHGRIDGSENSNQNFVLSRKDYSRTYLLEGYALDFLKNLFRNNTVAFIGYSVGDTLMQYIIDGISDSVSFSENDAYIFVEESSNEPKSNWNVTGLHSVAYQSHWDLWETFHQWAESIRDPENWRRCLLRKSSMPPGKLEPFERRQVVDMINTLTDPEVLLSARTSPEWLLVLDGYYRSGATLMSEHYKAILCTLLENYSLDNDPKPQFTAEREVQFNDTFTSGLGGEDSELPKGISEKTKYYDHFAPKSNNQMVQPLQLQQSNMSVMDYKEVTNRFASVVPWLLSNLDNPITVWWILWREFVSPNMFSEVSKTTRDMPDIDQIVAGCWSLIVNHMRRRGSSYTEEHRQRTFLNLLRKEWDKVSDEDLGLYVQYFLRSGNISERLATCDPASLTWEELVELLDQHWEDCCTHKHLKIILPPRNRICSAFEVLEAHYKKCYEMRKTLRLKPKQTPTCYPDVRNIGDSHNERPDPIFRLFSELSIEMAKANVKWLRLRMRKWPKNDYQYFHKIELMLMTKKRYCRVTTVVRYLEDLPDDDFWNIAIRREILSLIAIRMNEMGVEQREGILDRFLQPERDRDNTNAKVIPGRNRDRAARCMVWLVKNDAILSQEQWIVYEKMPNRYAGCTADKIPDNYQFEAWPVGIERDTCWLIKRPVSDIADIAELEGKFDSMRISRREDFGGLTHCRPAKALAFLTTFSRKGMYPVVLWEALLKNWPTGEKQRLNNVMQRRLHLVPKKIAVEYLWPLVEWLEKHFMKIIMQDSILAWSTFDFTVEVMVLADSLRNDASSPIDGADREGNLFINAADSCVYKLINCLLDVVKLRPSSDREIIPSIFKDKVSKLIGCRGMIGAYTVSIMGSMYKRLYSIEDEWIHEILDRFFDHNNEYASFAWSGLLWGRCLPHTMENSHIFKNIENVLFEEGNQQIDVGDLSRFAAEMITILWIFGKHESAGLHNDRVRVLLRKMGSVNRKVVIDTLTTIMEEEYKENLSTILSFAENVWPKDKKCRSSVETVSWVRMLSNSGDSLPQAYSAVKKFLVPVDTDHEDMLMLFTTNEASAKTIAEMFPTVVLEMLNIVLDGYCSAPIELSNALKQIASSGEVDICSHMYIRLDALV